MANDYPSRCEATERLLLEAVREAGRWISGDLRVKEETAAWLLGLSPASLANKRAEGTAPRFYRLGQISYRLSDIAEHIEAARVDADWIT
jgi:hypothetical protein